MADQRARDLIKRGGHLYGKKVTLDSLWQELADNFYVERADFTRTRTLGEDFAAHLMSSRPLLIRRDLQNAVSTMLRPTGQSWFSIGAMHEDIEVADQDSKIFLEWMRDSMRRAMYDRKSQFIRASKEGDGDFVTFGQAVKQVVLTRDRTGLSFRCWHLKDCAWAEGYDGHINEIHRKWRPTLEQLYSQFQDKTDPRVKQELDKANCDPYREIECRHVVLPSEVYKDFKTRHPFVSIYIDVEHESIIEEVGLPTMGGYWIPRWATVSGGWQYSFSPFAMNALPDARLNQAIARVLLEASEISIYPPALAVENVIRGDINRYASGITWVDAKYEGKIQDAFYERPANGQGIKIGEELQGYIRESLSDAAYLNKLNLPAPDGKMTAFEVAQRTQEYIRNVTPVFEPIEFEDNGAMCEEVFSLMLHNGAFGRPDQIPDALKGRDIQFQFTSPLTQALGAERLGKWGQSVQVLAQAMQIDPGAAAEFNTRKAFRSALSDGIGDPADWLNTDDQAVAIRNKIAQDQAAAQLANQIHQGAQVAEQVGKAGQALNAAAGPQEQAQAA